MVVSIPVRYVRKILIQMCQSNKCRAKLVPTVERQVMVQYPVHYVLLDKIKTVMGVLRVQMVDINRIWSRRLVKRVIVVDRQVMVQYPVPCVLLDNMSTETNVCHVAKVHFNQAWKKHRAHYAHMAVHH